MDFSDYDRVDEQALNRILWHSIKGENVPMPAPVRRALAVSSGLLSFPIGDADDHDDDDDDDDADDRPQVRTPAQGRR